jgi:hypothetical protein
MTQLNIPFHEELNRHCVKPGHCLDHVKILVGLGDSPYLLAMGNVQVIGRGSIQHCWLESDAIVVDLILPTRFFDRADYYQDLHPQNVRRFTPREAAIKMLRAGAVEFWN